MSSVENTSLMHKEAMSSVSYSITGKFFAKAMLSVSIFTFLPILAGFYLYKSSKLLNEIREDQINSQLELHAALNTYEEIRRKVRNVSLTTLGLMPSSNAAIYTDNNRKGSGDSLQRNDSLKNSIGAPVPPSGNIQDIHLEKNDSISDVILANDNGNTIHVLDSSESEVYAATKFKDKYREYTSMLESLIQRDVVLAVISKTSSVKNLSNNEIEVMSNKYREVYSGYVFVTSSKNAEIRENARFIESIVSGHDNRDGNYLISYDSLGRGYISSIRQESPKVVSHLLSTTIPTILSSVFSTKPLVYSYRFARNGNVTIFKDGKKVLDYKTLPPVMPAMEAAGNR